MRKIYSETPEAIFVPTSYENEPNDFPNARGFYKCVKYLGAGEHEPRCINIFPRVTFHADPLIFAERGSTTIESITYGEDDIETGYIWTDRFVDEL